MVRMFLTMLIAAAGTASAPVSIFGVEIGRRLSLQECAPNESYLKYHASLAEKKPSRRLGKPFLVYDRPTNSPCYQRWTNEFSTGPLVREGVTISFPLSERPELLIDWKVSAFVIDGSVQLITFRTLPFRFQDTILDTLKRKFGEPSSLDPVSLQNGFGARFEALTAVWHPSQTITATYSSFTSDEGGDFTIGTPAGAAGYQARYGTPQPTLKL
jgi:hypothetical protein